MRPGVAVAPEAPELIELTSRWAALLGRPTDDLLVCSSAPEAAAVLLGAVLQPGDTVVLAAPAPDAAVAAILRSGARFVDVGRTWHGALEPAAVELALRFHPGAWLLLVQGDSLAQHWPSLLQAGVQPERTFCWEDHHLGGGGMLMLQPAPVGVLLTLRDPAAPQTPLLWGVLTRGAGPALRALGGTPQLHPLVVDAARRALDGWTAQPEPTRALANRLGAAERSLALEVARWPGAVLWLGSGVERWVRCAAGDAGGLAEQLARAGWAAHAASCPAVGSAVRVRLLPAPHTAEPEPSARQD